MSVATRISPSPTGRFHIGTARTALFNYLYAKKHNGSFFLRFEDTDRQRSALAFEKDILESLKWLGLSYEEVVRQSEGAQWHGDEMTRLIETKNAYRSKEKHPETGVESVVVRFKNTREKISFEDTVRGMVTTDISDLGDFIIGRGDGSVLYNFAVVADDYRQGITHIIRGEDHISNTPRQIALQEALGYPRPVYTHLPLIHDADGSKLSKRKDSFSVLSLKQCGYLPEAVLNYLVTLGWTPGGEYKDQELFSLAEMADCFSLGNISRSRAIFSPQKLDWYGRQYFQKLPARAIQRRIFFPSLRAFGARFLFGARVKQRFLTKDIRQRCGTYDEARTLVEEYVFLYKRPPLHLSALLKHGDGETTRTHLEKIRDILKGVSVWGEEALREVLFSYADTAGRAEVLWPFRYLLTGAEKSPDGIALAALLGKKETLARIRSALFLL